MKKKTKILVSCLSILVAASSLTAAVTYAWTTSGRTNYINSIDISMNTERNLKISSTRSDFVSDLKFESPSTDEKRLYQPISSYPFLWQNDSEYMSSTPRGDYDLIDPLFYDAFTGINNTRVPQDPSRLDLEDGYFSKHLYLSCDDDVYVTIDPDNFRIESDETKNRNWAKVQADRLSFASDVEKENYINQKTNELNSIKNSLRVSILYKDEEGNYKYFIIHPEKKETTSYLGILNSSTTQYYDTFYENNQAYETLYGYIKDDNGNIIAAAKAEDLMDYYEPLSQEDVLRNMDSNHPATGYEDTTSFNSYTKKGTHHMDVARFSQNHNVVQEESYTPEQLRPTSVRRESPIMIPVSKNSGNEDYIPTEIVISVYLEGWDRTCINETMGATFDCNLKFMIARESGK